MSHTISRSTTRPSNETHHIQSCQGGEKHVSSLRAARMQQCHLLEVDLPEVQLQGLAGPRDIPVKFPGFWADTGSLFFICSGGFV